MFRAHLYDNRKLCWQAGRQTDRGSSATRKQANTVCTEIKTLIKMCVTLKKFPLSIFNSS